MTSYLSRTFPCQDSARNTYRPALQPAWLKHDRQVLRPLGLAKDFPHQFSFHVGVSRFVGSNRLGWNPVFLKHHWGSMHIFRTELNEISCFRFVAELHLNSAGSGSWESQGPQVWNWSYLFCVWKNLGSPGTSSPFMGHQCTNPWQESFRIRECNILFYLVLWLYRLWLFLWMQTPRLLLPKINKKPWTLQENSRKMVQWWCLWLYCIQPLFCFCHRWLWDVRNCWWT